MADPITIITTISAGLKLVDQFRDLALRFVGQSPHAPGTHAEQSGDAIQVTTNGHVAQVVDANALHLDQWDDVRYRALETRTRLSWSVFNELYSQTPILGPAEAARVKVTMENTKRDLCGDFREMVRIYERTLGTSLPDHYQLYEVCPG